MEEGSKIMELLEKYSERITVICFRKDPQTNKDVILEYPRTRFATQSCIWNDPSFDYNHQRRVVKKFPPFEAKHTFGSPALFKPSMSEIMLAMPMEYLSKINAVTIEYNGLTDDNTRHKSIVTPYILGEAAQSPKKKYDIPVLSAEEEKRLHPSSLKIGDLIDSVLDKYCQVVIKAVDPTNGWCDKQIYFDGIAGNIPEELRQQGFRPITVEGDDPDIAVNLIIN